MSCLSNAFMDPEREEFWRGHADKLESKFSTAHARHYSHFLYPDETDGTLT